jgi:glycosyltransferase involved in cell wall biosynthesis
MIHFVYASTPGIGAMSRLRGKASRVAQAVGIPLSYIRDRDTLDTSSWPVHAPLSITHHVLGALRGLDDVRFYDWKERVLIRHEPSDVLIGHPFPDDLTRAFNRACLEGHFAARVALNPLHYGLPEYCQALAPALDSCDHILGITGPYWFDTWSQGPFARWTPKITHLDMAIEISHFPRVKRTFNSAGRRKFLFIGNGGPPKGVHLLSQLFGLAEGKHRCVWIGADRKLPNLECRPFQRLQGQVMERLAAECDVFLSLGVSDANPTTILESMAWGFPVACTPQSGYYRMSEIKELSTTDMAHNLAMLDYFQSASESELLQIADRARSLVETRFTFERYTRTVVDTLVRLAPHLGRQRSEALGHAARHS